MKLKLLLIVAMLFVSMNAMADTTADDNESLEEDALSTTPQLSEEPIEYQIHDCDTFSVEYPENWLVMDLTDMANYLWGSLDEPIDDMFNVSYMFLEMPSFNMLFDPDEDFENMTMGSFIITIDNADPVTYSVVFDKSMLTPEGAPNQIIKHAVDTLRIKDQSDFA